MQAPTAIGTLSLSVKVFQIVSDCGDLSDDITGPNEPTRSNRLAATGGGAGDGQLVESLSPMESGDLNPGAPECGPTQTQCDGTSWSGRQLDLCGVCGGGCLPPACAVQACPELNALIVRIR